jgi:hypothetical protein
MSNRQRDTKISDFLGATSLNSSDLVTIVQGGTNKKISVSDFINYLGFAGSIIQDGAVTGTPVLDDQGLIKAIRNIEDGSGLLSSISPENGIKLEHNFDFKSVGASLTPDSAASQVVMRSIVAGAGITVSATSDQIQISASGAEASTKTILISEIADLPAPVSGVITLEADTEYRFLDDITFASTRMVGGNNTVLSGGDSSIIDISYTGAGDFITSVGNSITIKDLSVTASSGTAIDFTGGNGDVLTLTDVRITAGTCVSATGTDGLAAIQVTESVVLFSTDGFVFTGDFGAFTFDLSFGIQLLGSGSVFDMSGGSTFGSVNVINSLFNSSSGTGTFLKGDAASANIVSLGTVINCRLINYIPLSGITVDDAKWQFYFNDDIRDSRTDALLSLQANATNTVITVAGTAVKVAGTWVVEGNSQMTGDTTGRVTYDGVKDAVLPVTVSLSLEPVSGGAQVMAAYIAVNGVVVANSKRTATASSGSQASITVPWQLTLSPTDYVEAWVANDSATNDVLVSSAVLRVN